MDLEIGLYLEAEEGVTWSDWRRLARRAEAGGFDALATAVHLRSLQAPGRWCLDLWPVMTALALWTRRLRFGPMVLPVAFYHPAQVARLAAALDRLSRGRFRLRLGAGRDAAEHHAFGLPFPDHDERIAALGEAVALIRRLWSGQPVSFAGRWYRLAEAQIQPTPLRPWLGLGGESDPLLRLAAAQADEWCTAGPTLERFRWLQARLDDLARAAGRDPHTLARTVMSGVVIGRDRAALQRRAHRLTALIPTLAGHPPAAVLARLASEWRWWIGTPAEIVAQTQPFIQAGATQVFFQVFDPHDLAAVDLLAQEVLPALRAVAATRPAVACDADAVLRRPGEVGR